MSRKLNERFQYITRAWEYGSFSVQVALIGCTHGIQRSPPPLPVHAFAFFSFVIYIWYISGDVVIPICVVSSSKWLAVEHREHKKGEFHSAALGRRNTAYLVGVINMPTTVFTYTCVVPCSPPPHSSQCPLADVVCHPLLQ